MQITVLFAQYGSKLKIATVIRVSRENSNLVWDRHLPKNIKKIAWQEFSKIMRMPLAKLKKKYSLMGRYTMPIPKSSIWIS